MSAPREECPRIEDSSEIRSAYGRYLRDESSLSGGLPQRIYLPDSIGQLLAAVREVRRRGERLTVSGARTGIVGGAVPQDGDNLLTMEKMRGEPKVMWSEACKRWSITVPPSLTLEGLKAVLETRRYSSIGDPPRDLFYPVDPTESAASLGGNVATNASGARSLYYGPTRRWVGGLTVVLADGAVARLRRGEGGASAGLLTFEARDDESSGPVGVRLPRVTLPMTKHAAGYHVSPGMEPVDLFIGAEGTLGIVAEIEIALARMPGVTIGVCAFLHEAETFLDLLAHVKEIRDLRPTALEYMDGNSLRLLADYRGEAGESSGVPNFPQGKEAMLYVEAGCADEKEADSVLERVSHVLESLGIPEDCTWAGVSPEDLERMRKFRHALPERVNSIVAGSAAAVTGLAKLATDLAVPEAALAVMMGEYRRELGESMLPHVMFGHVGDSHIHMNILPRTLEDMERGRKMCVSLARRAVELGGSVSAEHGIGKLKKHLLEIQFPPAELEGLKSIKRQLDPHGVLNPGVMW